MMPPRRRATAGALTAPLKGTAPSCGSGLRTEELLQLVAVIYLPFFP
jgi:hypothetical protein